MLRQLGYYITAPVSRPGYISLPCEKILSVSRCICDIHPDLTGCYFINHIAHSAYKNRLGLSDDKFRQLKTDISELIDRRILSLDSCFAKLPDALYIFRNFLQNIPDLKIIGISTDEKYFDTLIAEGFDVLSNSSLSDEINGALIGGEILGWDNGSFHSYLCNSLEKEILEKYTMTVSQTGLIQNSFEEITQFAEHIKRLGEPVQWIPFLLHNCTE